MNALRPNCLRRLLTESTEQMFDSIEQSPDMLEGDKFARLGCISCSEVATVSQTMKGEFRERIFDFATPAIDSCPNAADIVYGVSKL